VAGPCKAAPSRCERREVEMTSWVDGGLAVVRTLMTAGAA
jgi:hypothetical protein